jgi:hypothetical protein
MHGNFGDSVLEYQPNPNRPIQVLILILHAPLGWSGSCAFVLPTKPIDSVCLSIEPTRSNRSHVCYDPCDLTISRYCTVILQYHLSFWYNELNHFVRVNSAILLDILKILSQSFCMNSVIFYYSAQSFHDATILHHSSCYSDQLFLVPHRSVISRCYSTQSFFTAAVLRHFSLLQCSTIPHAKRAQSLLIATVFRYFSLLQCSVVPHVKRAQSFILATVISHFPLQKSFSYSSMLQYSAIFHCCSAQPFYTTTTHGATQSFCKIIELGHDRGSTRARGGSWLDEGGRRLGHGRA